MSLSKALAIVCILLLALLMFSLAPVDQQSPLPHAQGAEPQKAAATEQPKPPADITKLADAPTEEGFDDQGSEDGNRPFFDDFSWRGFVALNWPAKDGQRGVPDKTSLNILTEIRNICRSRGAPDYDWSPWSRSGT